MNRDDSLRLLLNEFKEYGSSIIAHTSFYTEFTDIIAKSGMEKPIINEFISKLGYLAEHKKQSSMLYPQKFEWLRHVDLYSMHIDKRRFNIRILYYFTENNNIIVLLCAFDEKSDKSSTDYTKPIKSAQQRLQEYKVK